MNHYKDPVINQPVFHGKQGRFFFSWLNFTFQGAIFQKIPIAEGNPQQKTKQPGVLGVDFGPWWK